MSEIKNIKSETCSVSLTDEEKSVLYNYHHGKGKYWSNCESTNRRISKKSDPNTTELFLSEPCAELPMTPNNWLKRAEIFKEWKLERWRRAQMFSSQNSCYSGRWWGTQEDGGDVRLVNETELPDYPKDGNKK